MTAQTRKLYPFMFQPGINRDNTPASSKQWVDSNWIRFYGGRPLKINGYFEIYNLGQFDKQDTSNPPVFLGLPYENSPTQESSSSNIKPYPFQTVYSYVCSGCTTGDGNKAAVTAQIPGTFVYVILATQANPVRDINVALDSGIYIKIFTTLTSKANTQIYAPNVNSNVPGGFLNKDKYIYTTGTGTQVMVPYYIKADGNAHYNQRDLVAGGPYMLGINGLGSKSVQLGYNSTVTVDLCNTTYGINQFVIHIANNYPDIATSVSPNNVIGPNPSTLPAFSPQGYVYTMVLDNSIKMGDVSNDSAPQTIPVFDAKNGTGIKIAQNNTGDGFKGDLQVSGGICSVGSRAFAFGDAGKIYWSDVNDASEYNHYAIVASDKIVAGRQMRGGQNAPAALFWSLSSLIRVVNVNSGDSDVTWKFDTISTTVSVMSYRSMVDLNGVFYWMGIDRFYLYNGQIQEVPNTTTLLWFLNDINMEARQRVWADVVPSRNEIWWHYPSTATYAYAINPNNNLNPQTGDNAQCDSAIIYNVQDNTWYTVRFNNNELFNADGTSTDLTTNSRFKYDGRSHGMYNSTLGGNVSGGVASFHYHHHDGDGLRNPIYFNGPPNVSGNPTVGVADSDIIYYVSADFPWVNAGDPTLDYLRSNPLSFSFTSPLISFANQDITGQMQCTDVMSLVTRFEPDFRTTSKEYDVLFSISGTYYANQPVTQQYPGPPYYNGPDEGKIKARPDEQEVTSKLDFTIQNRYLQFTLSSNSKGFDFLLGNSVLTLEAGDKR